MLKRLILVLALIGSLAACSPGSSPSVTVPGVDSSPSLDASPSGSDSMESPGGSDDESPSGSDDMESASPSSS